MVIISFLKINPNHEFSIYNLGAIEFGINKDPKKQSNILLVQLL